VAAIFRLAWQASRLLSFYTTGITTVIYIEVDVVIEEAVVQNSGTHHPEDSIMGRDSPKARAAAV
jgi:hypothetical protein